MKLLYFFIIGILFFNSAQAQKNLPLSISVVPKTGFLIAHRPYMSHLVKDRNNAVEIEFSQQDNSRNFTSTYYRFLSRGFTVQYQNFGYDEVLGSGYSIMQFMKFNILQNKKLGFIDFRIGSGLSYVTKKYNLITNLKNNAIGSNLNAYIDFQLGYSYTIKNLVFGTGISISHYSNAAIKMPNLGLNTPMIFAKIGYQINQREIFQIDTNPVISILPRYTLPFQVNVIGSVKQNLPGKTISKFYPVIATQFLYRRFINFKWDVELGLDVIYNRANQFKYDDVVYSFKETVQVGITLGMAANFYQSQIFFGVGGYFANKINPSGWIYNRIGYRYFFTNSLSALVAIKANIGIADYLEFGLGWNF